MGWAVVHITGTILIRLPFQSIAYTVSATCLHGDREGINMRDRESKKEITKLIEDYRTHCQIYETAMRSDQHSLFRLFFLSTFLYETVHDQVPTFIGIGNVLNDICSINNKRKKVIFVAIVIPNSCFIVSI